MSTGGAWAGFPQIRKSPWPALGSPGSLPAMTTEEHFDPSVPFLRADGLRAGMSRRQLQNARFRSFARDVVVPNEGPMDTVARCAALRLVLPPRAMFSHLTAAELCKIPAPRDPLIHLSVVSEFEPRIDGVVGHRALELPDPQFACGLPVTPPGRTFVDLAARLDLRSLVAAGDALARLSGSKAELTAAVEHGAKRRGIRLARTALRFVDPRADSAPESHLRMLLILAGFPPDLVNEYVYDEQGRIVAKPDLAYLVRLALEYEGAHHLREQRQWDSDIRRDASYQDSDWYLIKVTKTALYEHPDQLVRDVGAVLAQRRWRAP